MKKIFFGITAAMIASTAAFAAGVPYQCEFENGCSAEGSILIASADSREVNGTATFDLTCEGKKGNFTMSDDEARAALKTGFLRIDAKDDGNRAVLVMKSPAGANATALVEVDAKLKINHGPVADGKCTLTPPAPGAN